MEKMTKKKTQKEMYNYIIGLLSDNQEVVDFCKGRIEILDNKSSNSGQTKTQKENALIKDRIVSALVELGKAVTITELQNEYAEFKDYSNQKMSALLNQLADVNKDNRIVKVIDKKKTYFSAKAE